ncbi:isoaspartyl peptidase/L-asparaginase family protein [Deinococcus cellulosilyticus]|uniref:Asparaginase n=1 Tax=Deinococcus cellulosilyticus (strain DSM 18568 / NBRC 106333 / KACC 11606 / 5516J-15) TaxID=1223518 RepID=A0A511N0W9_DEIC1|nr:isoaspartyl peptidase/L-asparaginase family protein [Deinococcus cellulosilyticus]GEM46107.1 asparaginase [Deinococcus cellulosilyticus NBRC 106333 = KACC 11606]
MPEPTRVKYVIMVHGGAKPVPEEKEQANLDGVARALEAGHQILRDGGSALDAAEAALRVLEHDPAFNCGYGSSLNEKGEVQMDSAMMNGEDLQIGAVGFVQGVKHPVSIARTILKKESTLITGLGAHKYAEEHGLELCDNDILITEEQVKKLEKKQKEKNTVGCVALDQKGNLVAATSTGGLTGTPEGRVGDSPLSGCGFYAENGTGAVAISGDGEEIMRYRLASRTMEKLPTVGPEIAVTSLIKEMHERIGGEAGGLVLSPQGDYGWFHNSSHFPCAFVTSEMSEPKVYLKKDEEPQKVVKENARP